MRRMFVKYMSALLVVWYSLSIIGFDVHSCNATGEVYVASLAGGIACEDVHPDHSCAHHGACCSHHHENSCCHHRHHDSDSRISDQNCCSNDVQVLQLTGVVISEDESYGSDVRVHQTDCYAYLTIDSATQALQRRYHKYLEYPDPGVTMPDRQAFLNIWRV